MSWLALGILCLLAVALFLGDRLRRRHVEARAYLKGVRYVLSDDPDSAIEALSDVARLGSPEAFETYLALGALFRRTGDLAHAIRLHKNMLLRPGLEPAQRVEVSRELGHDYRRGGMLEDSEQVFRSLSEGGDRAAAEALRDVLVDRGRLHEAAQLQRTLGSRDDPDHPILAHLLAALARAELAQDPRRARETARTAVGACARSADALLALAEAEAAGGDVAAARSAAAAAIDADPSCALLSWPALAAMPHGAAMEVVDGRIGRDGGDAALHLLRGRLLHAAGRNADAVPALRKALDLDVTGEVTLAMRDLLREAEAPGPDELAARHDLMVSALLRRARPVRCRRCGVEAPARAWRCRRCGAFESFASAPDVAPRST